MAQPLPARRTTARGTRRKAQLIQASARLFQERGFHSVSMDDIASDVGITGPALYRHFRSKHDVLAAVLDVQIRSAEEVVEQTLKGRGDPAEQLQEYFEQLAALVLDVYDALLWTRERHSLSHDARKALRDRLTKVRQQMVAVLRRLRPELSRDDATVLAWTIMAVYTRTSEYRAASTRSAAARALTQIAWAIATCDLASAPHHAAVPNGRHVPPVNSRRERVLESATELFYERGYYQVSVEDIAEASQTAIATVYQLFTSKADLLYAILVRGSEGTTFVTAHRLAALTEADVAASVTTIWSIYLELALGPHGRLLRILSNDGVYLPPEMYRNLRRSEREYVEEWVRALAGARPELPASDIAVRVSSAIAVLTELSQITPLRRRPNMAGELGLIAETILYA